MQSNKSHNSLLSSIPLPLLEENHQETTTDTKNIQKSRECSFAHRAETRAFSVHSRRRLVGKHERQRL